jgi:hypothetical protein
MFACLFSVFVADNITLIEENANSTVRVSANTAQSYTDDKINIESLSFSEVSDYIYTGKSITPNVTIKHDGKTLDKDKDYLLFYSKNKNVGTAKIMIGGIGNYTGIKELTFKINERSIDSATIDGLAAKEYTGENVTQSLTLQYNGITLKNGTDYTLTYKNNKEIGRAKVIITGKGNFSSDKTLTFKIVPQKPIMQDVTVTYRNIKIEWSKVSDVTGYIVYMSKDGGEYSKIETISENIVSNYTVEDLEEGSYSFKVRSYKIVDKMGYYSSDSLEKTVEINNADIYDEEMPPDDSDWWRFELYEEVSPTIQDVEIPFLGDAQKCVLTIKNADAIADVYLYMDSGWIGTYIVARGRFSSFELKLYGYTVDLSRSGQEVGIYLEECHDIWPSDYCITFEKRTGTLMLALVDKENS